MFMFTAVDNSTSTGRFVFLIKKPNRINNMTRSHMMKNIKTEICIN